MGIETERRTRDSARNTNQGDGEKKKKKKKKKEGQVAGIGIAMEGGFSKRMWAIYLGLLNDLSRHRYLALVHVNINVSLGSGFLMGGAGVVRRRGVSSASWALAGPLGLDDSPRTRASLLLIVAGHLVRGCLWLRNMSIPVPSHTPILQSRGIA
ncbi:hypothetical protein B0J15DRAFT_468877 [Fusarium solani]|uniref:Uncharacterized protein n=1 Tax=Fusarium solani TaxID=169388 RepID=A0A9P9GWC8_FUSSL|nr:uncharacterized protein B0J15DRAFT_468877 [Fusarium solani]KAH7246798.1 hypothetical protein B0J15DRAFT_468877 [Fusarium solani]